MLCISQLTDIFRDLEGFRNVRVSRLFPVGDIIGVDYEVTVASSSSIMVHELSEFFATKTQQDERLGNSEIILTSPGGKWQ